jgi:hypothetical protein
MNDCCKDCSNRIQPRLVTTSLTLPDHPSGHSNQGREPPFKMSFSNSITSAVLSVTIAAAALAPLSSTANARDWDRGGPDRGGPAIHDHDFAGHRGERGGGRHEGRWHRNGDRDLAIGAFATVLGLAIAAEASRDYRHGDRY